MKHMVLPLAALVVLMLATVSIVRTQPRPASRRTGLHQGPSA